MDVNERLPEKRTILVLTDFSNCAKNAGDYGALLAENLNADLLLCHSFFVPDSGFDTWPKDDYVQLQQRSKDRLEQEAARLKKLLDNRSSDLWPSIETLSAAGTIAENVPAIMAERPGIMMVVMGGYRARNNDDFSFGTAIKDVLGQAKCPAVIVPEFEFIKP